MKNRKGFTIVELVIVIAVIAILAAVLIPTFSGVIAKANASSSLQLATSTMKATLAMSQNGTIANGTQFIIVSGDSVSARYKYENNKIAEAKVGDPLPTSFGEEANISWNSIIISNEFVGSDNKLSDAGAKLVKAALGLGEAAGFNTQMAASSSDYYTLTYGTDATCQVFVSSDYSKDIVTVTYSN